jgi:uncharacterized membrane protein
VTSVALFIAVFLACAVEAVEATTIVLASGLSRDWRSTLFGAAGALVVLAAVTAALGPAVSSIPLRGLRLFVGSFLLVFGLQWLRKAILRASGHKSLHDEDEIFKKNVAAAQQASVERRSSIRDWYAFSLSFKGVLLEGLEVVFIVLTFGTNEHKIPLAALAALSAVVVVVATGVVVRAPLSRVPENSMKFVVGVMLTAFGMFWAGEGAGAHWPGSDAMLIGLVPAVAVVALGFVALLRRPSTRTVSALPS